MTLDAYRRTAQRSETPRQTEQRLIAQITTAMVRAQEEGRSGAALMPELHRNRELWSTLSADCGAPGNNLPADLRAAIVSLALWVDRHTSAVVTGREPLEPLIEINRSVMEGLAGA